MDHSIGSPTPFRPLFLRIAAAGLLFIAAALPARAQQQPATEQRRLQILAGQPREQQFAPANQAFLQSLVRRGALLYLHRLDGLACRDLFSLGDEVLFAGAVGNTDGSDHNLVYLEGEGAPAHYDGGPYRLPADTHRAYWPPTADRNTYWHECNHALLDTAGLGIAAAPYAASLDNASEGQGWGAHTAATSADSHHPFIEGVGQRNAEAYEALSEFEEAARKADLAESEYLSQGREIDYAVERQLWADAHHRFSGFLKRMKRVANMPPEALAAYRQATGIFFSTAEQVAEFYRSGGLKRQQRGEVLPIKPPAWVFYPDLLLMPVRIELRDADGRDLEQPGVAGSAKFEIKDGIYRQEFRVNVRARGSQARMTGNLAQKKTVGAAVARGTLRIRLVEDEPLVTLSVSQGAGGGAAEGIEVPGGNSQQLFGLDLKEDGALPVRVVFAHRKLSELREPTTYHVELRYTDPGADRLYDASSAQVSFALGPGAGPAPSTATAPKPAAEPEPAPAAAPAQPEKKSQRGEKLGATMSWGPLPEGFAGAAGSMYETDSAELPPQGERELVSGPFLYFKRGKWGTDGIVVEFYARKLDNPPHSIEENAALLNAGWQAPLFKHSEVTVGGRRGYLSLMRTGSGQKVNWVYNVEVDPKQSVWVAILTDLQVNKANVDLAPVLESAHSRIIASLRFGPDPSAMGVENTEEKPLPKAFTDAPIEEEELLRRPPPPKTEPERSDSKSKATQYVAPGGWSLTLPGSWKRGARAEGAQLFDSAAKRFVLACPDAMLAPPTDFASFRGALAEQWRSRDPGAKVETRDCGGLALLLVKEGGAQNLWHLYVGGGSRAVELRVLGMAGATQFPGELFEAACGLKGVSP